MSVVQETQILNDEPVLPVARNAMAQRVVEGVRVIKTFLAPGVNTAQFIGAVVQEANQLNLSLSAAELEDRRTITSFIRAAFNCAVLGLIPGEVLGHAYLIPYKMNRGKPTEFTSINLIPGYRGLLELAFAANYLEVCQPEVVIDGEPCRVWHDTRGPQIEHEIPLNRDEPSLENIMAAYCTYTPRGGHSTLGKVITGRELRILARNATRRSPWNSGSYAEMCCKTSIRRTSKQWRLTRQLAQAVQLDEHAERNEVQPSLVHEPETKQETIDLDELPEIEEQE